MFVQKYLLLLFSTLLGRACLFCVYVCVLVLFFFVYIVFIFNKSAQARRAAQLQWIKLLKSAREQKQQNMKRKTAVKMRVDALIWLLYKLTSSGYTMQR